MAAILIILFIILCVDRNKYCWKTKDYSLQGYWENLKRRFWYKKETEEERNERIQKEVMEDVAEIERQLSERDDL